MTTLAGLLYPDAQNAPADLEAALRSHDLLQPALAWPGVPGQVSKGILEFLEMPIGNLGVSAYQKHRRIKAAMRETAKSPGMPRVVKLMEHTIESKFEPTVDIEVEGVTKTLLRLELKARITVEAVTAVVESGQVVDITPGSASADLTLSAAGVELAKAKTQPVDLALPKEARIVIDLTATGEPITHPAVAE